MHDFARLIYTTRRSPLVHATSSGVACIVVFFLDAGDREWKNARGRGGMREREVAEWF
jgi:hypothetical protein